MPHLQLHEIMAGQQMQLEDWLDDLCVRFLINLPQEDLSSVERICFQVEEAQWFYEDFIRPLDPSMPSMSLRTFCLRIFQHCPLMASFSAENHLAAFESFLQYKTRIPVRGAILLNHEMDSVVLVKGWKKSASWSFPRGKINKDEDDLDCAVREVFEETGMDLRAHDLIPTTENPKYIEIAMREQQLRLYVFRHVPMDYDFQPQTRKEISKIQWYKLSELTTFKKKNAPNQSDAAVGANKFYMVAPFLAPLKKWINKQKQQEGRRKTNLHLHASYANLSVDEGHTEDEIYAPVGHEATRSQQEASITSLDGTTQEPQHLLKTQPSTQGLQPTVTREDKGSALLSILQSENMRSTDSGSQQGMGQLPHTPYGHTMSNPAQPQNPHHHNNQRRYSINASDQEPPPSFPLQHGTANNFPQQQHPHYQYPGQPAPPTQTYSNAPRHQSQKSIPLVHTQPLPPQIQRAMFNNSAFQSSGGNPHPMPSYQHWSQAATAQGKAPTQQAAPSVQLSGQSMALLNAFKREPSGPQQPVDQRQRMHVAGSNVAASAGPTAQNVATGYGQPLYQQPPQQQRPQDIPAQSGPPHMQYGYALPQQHQQHPGGMLNQAPINDPHRSTLLGMFKEAKPQSLSKLPPAAQLHSPSGTSGLIPERAVPAPPQHNPPSNLPVEMGINSLSIQPGLPNQHHQGPAQRSGSIASPYVAHAPVSYQPLQPPSVSLQSALLPGDPGAGGDKKRHLLSLFGSAGGGRGADATKQATLQVQMLGGPVHEMGNGAPARVASLASSSAGTGAGEPNLGGASRGGSQTPISPADESFLLGYLQSVTNNTSR